MIEKVIDLIMENFFLFFVIIGIISSLFGKDKKETNKPNRPKQPQQQKQQRTSTVTTVERKLEEMAKSLQTQAKKVSDSVNPEREKEVKSSSPVQLEQQRSNMYEQYANQVAELERKAEETAMTVKSLQSTTSLPYHHRQKKLKTYSKNNLVNGLIMYEILSPPRAKKKFR